MSILSDLDLALRARHYRSRRVRQTDPFRKLRSARNRGVVSFACSLLRCVRLRINLSSRSERELAGHHHGLVRLNTTFDHGEISILTLSRFHRAKIDRVVRL